MKENLLAWLKRVCLCVFDLIWLNLQCIFNHWYSEPREDLLIDSEGCVSTLLQQGVVLKAFHGLGYRYS